MERIDFSSIKNLSFKMTYIDDLNHFSKQSFISNLNIHVSPFFRSSGPILLSSKFRFFIWLYYRAIVLMDLLFRQKIDWLIIEHLNLAILKKIVSLLIHSLSWSDCRSTPFYKWIIWMSPYNLLSLDLVVVIGQFLRASSDVHYLHLLVYCVLLGFVTVLKICVFIRNS